MIAPGREQREKRNFIRMRVDSPVQVSIEGHPNPVTGTCRNLSGGGMLIELESTLPVGTEVEITLASAHGHAPMLRAKAVVTRVSGQPGADVRPTSRIGLQIRELLD